MASECHESHTALFYHSRMPSQPFLITCGELLHHPTAGNVVGHEDRLLNKALNAFLSSQKNKLLEAISLVLNVLEQNHGISKDVVDLQGHLPSACCWNNQNKSPSDNRSDKVGDASNENNEQVVLKENNNFERHRRSKSKMVYHPISKTTYAFPLKNVFDTLNGIFKPSLHKDAHEVSNDDKLVEEVQVDSSVIRKVSNGFEKTSLEASNILSSSEIVAFSLSEL
ncbi:hypothetical protein Q3G72_006717 [Acer saccharum]|nr:hypothetical protein Q3G72_006717 [Acer saccharum]